MAAKKSWRWTKKSTKKVDKVDEIVVEHDTDTMLESDYLIDIGPLAGEHGGEVIAYGTPEEVMKNKNSLTGKYLTGKEKIEIPTTRRS